VSKLRNPTNGSWWIVQIQPTTDNALETENPTNGSWWIVQIQPTTDKALETENPHPREWVDCSDPTYQQTMLSKLRNPTHGSGWDSQASPMPEVDNNPAANYP
jgi:hypothetical protein